MRGWIRVARGVSLPTSDQAPPGGVANGKTSSVMMAACRSLATALPVLTIGVWLQRTFRDLESRLWTTYGPLWASVIKS